MPLTKVLTLGQRKVTDVQFDGTISGEPVLGLSAPAAVRVSLPVPVADRPNRWRFVVEAVRAGVSHVVVQAQGAEVIEVPIDYVVQDGPTATRAGTVVTFRDPEPGE